MISIPNLVCSVGAPAGEVEDRVEKLEGVDDLNKRFCGGDSDPCFGGGVGV